MYKDVKPVLKGSHDLVILEQAVRNIDTYVLLAMAKTRIAFWGHGRTYTKSVSRLQETLKIRLTQTGVWFFGYTENGVKSVVTSGYDHRRTTIVQNAFDSASLKAGINALVSDEIAEFKFAHQLTSKTLIILGALDTSKRVDFLIDSIELLVSADPDIRVLICGDGDESAKIAALEQREPAVRWLGPVFGRAKELALASSTLILNPGRVGLVAIDSFASGVPIVTTNWAWHAPEFEYLVDGHNARITRSNVDDYCEEVLALLTDESARRDLGRGCVEASGQFTVENMVERFASGVVEALSSRSVSGKRGGNR